MVLEGDEMPHALQPIANAVDGVHMIGVNANDGGAAVLDRIKKILGGQAVVQGYDDGADLRYRIERFEHGMCVRRYDANTIAPSDTEFLQDRRPSIATVQELGICEAPAVIDDCFPV